MSFTTEDEDTVNALHAEDFAMKMRRVRKDIEDQKYRKPWSPHDNAVDRTGYWPTSSLASDNVDHRDERWTERLYHPKD